MADLIIKPNSATGDKLILQDRAGGAVLTTADSGATMASTVTGIPAAGVTGVLPVGVTGGSGLTALGTVTSGNLSNAAIVHPTGSVLKIHPFTNQNYNYNLTSDTYVSTGTGTTFTTLANTTAFVLHCKGRIMYYENSGDLPAGATAIYYHSSANGLGQAPTGSQIGNNETLGGYTTHTGVNGRWDLYLNYLHLYYVSCSGSTTYTLQVFGAKQADIYYMDFTYGVGTITELSG
jgi:hypothetical protein